MQEERKSSQTKANKKGKKTKGMYPPIYNIKYKRGTEFRLFNIFIFKSEIIQLATLL